MAPSVPYVRGAHPIGDGVWTYLQPDGGWGRSNAGLIASGDGASSLLVDTLFDLELTAEMLAAFMQAAPDMGSAGAFLIDIFGGFHFDGIESVAPTRTFTGELELSIGDRPVRLIEVGPAHTAGDVIVQVPDAGVVFTGDIVVQGGHPIVWAGPVSNWLAACDRILALDDVHTVVPGHGPVTDLGAVANLKDYFQRLTTHARDCLDAGLTPLEAARSIDLGPHARRREPERLVANINALYHDLGADVAADPLTVITLMAESVEADSTATVPQYQRGSTDPTNERGIR